MDANLSKWKVLGTRIISGILTASMLLSMLTTAAAADTTGDREPEPPVQTQEPVTGPDQSNDGETGGDEAEYSTPLVLDKSAIGFSADMLSTRVTATVTDVRYLGALDSLEEFAAFFPGDLDLDECAYLTEDLRQSIAAIPEADRQIGRAHV